MSPAAQDSSAPAWMAPGRSRVSTFLVCDSPIEVAGFAKTVFGAEERRAPLFRSDGRLWNLELALGEHTIMLGEATDGMRRPGFVYVHVPDADATYRAALDAGGRPVMEPEDRFYGDRDGGVEDIGGNWWWIASHRETLDDGEIEARAADFEAEGQPS
ncbi:VOC family protein [Histidinibacterium aquaticum]|uniref:VOC family protein n=1 Tax=Histidinibacterium aquaticum TaxID=2613962 RepID=A0A5J5GIF4_9RHOB|nr:VOC family protein [Histidinibacterium aquaticum]KAA9008039.1 VOC family protein [Histidinibacterium aquaticum]